MKKLLLFFALGIYTAQGINLLVPQPEKISPSDGFYPITDSCEFAINGLVNPQTTFAVQRLKEGLRYRTRLILDLKTSLNTVLNSGFTIMAQKTTKLYPGMDESYFIHIDMTGVTIKAATSVGALRAVETVLQLVERRDSLWVVPFVEISDKPQFAYRGLLLDPARHFLPIDAIKRTIQTMASTKLNVLHLHLTDDQGWRIESKKYPSLHIMGSDGYYYTQEQLTDLVNYAELRGILVIPEVDVPGHTTALLTAQPQLASKKMDYRIERKFGIQPPVLNPALEETYSFLSTLFKEIDSLFPGPYIHIGGDEVVFDHWTKNAGIDAFRKQKGLKDFTALQHYFINRLADSVRLTGKTIIGWEEIYGDGLKKDAVLQCWKNSQSVIGFANQGYKTIRSQGFYLDLLYPLQDYYNVDIIPKGSALQKESAKNVLGAEACIWGELVDERLLDYRLWPKMAMISERFWSVPKRDRRALANAVDAVTAQLAEHKLRSTGAPYGILSDIAGGKNIEPLSELRGLVTPVKGYGRLNTGNYTSLTPLNGFADAADTDPENLDLFYTALREFIIAGSNEANFDFVAQKLFEWESFYETNKTYFSSTQQLQELEPLAKNLSDAAKIANEAMGYIVRGKVPKDTWLTNAKDVMTEAKKPVSGVELSVIEQLEKLIVFSKDHDVIVF